MTEYEPNMTAYAQCIHCSLLRRSRPSISLRQPASQRVSTTVKEIRGSQRFQRNTKRRYDNLAQSAPPAKRLKSGVTLNQAVGELLYHGEKTFDQVRKVVSSRTAIHHTVNQLKSVLNEVIPRTLSSTF